MIKKIFFQSIFLSFLFFMEAFAAESGGMPQLNPEFWVSQIFWLTLTFGLGEDPAARSHRVEQFTAL
jgi:F-type H+-transporting ATPase subunit b